MQPISDTPLIVNLAPTGAVSDCTRNPNVPITEEAIVRDLEICSALGATVAHLHVRADDGAPCSDPERYQSLIEHIRNTGFGRELVLCVSTSGRHGQTLEQRAAVLDLVGPTKPNMASLTLGSLNFARDVSINSPDTIRQLARRMLEKGIKAELEIFDLGMVHFAKALIREGLLQPPHYFNLILGNPAGAQMECGDIAALTNHLPEDSIWSLGGIGRQQKPAVALGCVMAAGIRIGLEDNLWQAGHPGLPTTNIALLRWARALAETYGRPIATAAETRGMLGL